MLVEPLPNVSDKNKIVIARPRNGVGVIIPQVSVLQTICCSWSGLLEGLDHRISFDICLTPPRAENMRSLSCVFFPCSGFFFFIECVCRVCHIQYDDVCHCIVYCAYCIRNTRQKTKRKTTKQSKTKKQIARRERKNTDRDTKRCKRGKRKEGKKEKEKKRRKKKTKRGGDWCIQIRKAARVAPC